MGAGCQWYFRNPSEYTDSIRQLRRYWMYLYSLFTAYMLYSRRIHAHVPIFHVVGDMKKIKEEYILFSKPDTSSSSQNCSISKIWIDTRIVSQEERYTAQARWPVAITTVSTGTSTSGLIWLIDWTCHLLEYQTCCACERGKKHHKIKSRHRSSKAG